jgi:hypothetical protein
MRGWTALLTVDEVGVLLVAFDTPAGLNRDIDFEAARTVLTRFNASALVVLASALTPSAELFTPAGLHEAIDVPSGTRTAPHPSLSGLLPIDAIMKFLDQNSGSATFPWPERATVARVDVASVLRTSASTALGEVVAQGRRARIPAKVAGYKSAEALQDAFANALVAALSGEPIVDALSYLGEDES